jgi:hypothetical protein
VKKDNAREIIAELDPKRTKKEDLLGLLLRKSIMRKYKYYILLFLINLSFVSCGPDINEVSYSNHMKVTIESNLKLIHLDNLLFDSTTVYPYAFLDTVIYSIGSYDYTLYPVKDTGYINFKYYDSYGEHPGQVQLRDSLLINTPVDTTIIVIHGYSLNPHLYIFH